MDPGIFKELYTTDSGDFDAGLYRRAIGQLQHLSVRTRPDITFAVQKLSQFMSHPKKLHWKALFTILRYLVGTVRKGLVFSSRNIEQLVAFVDADWAGCPRTARSTSGYILMLAGAPIAWKSSLQTITALSTMEAEYVAACLCAQEVLWMRGLLDEIGFTPSGPTILHEDNQSCIVYSEVPKFRSSTKHIPIKFHFVRDQVALGNVILRYCESSRQLADVLTKPLARQAFEHCINLLTSIKG